MTTVAFVSVLRRALFRQASPPSQASPAVTGVSVWEFFRLIAMELGLIN
jgi:hypothetical protein